LSPAPAGRPARVDLDRATAPHETWQMDAKEHIQLQNHEEVSWLRLIDECSGAALWTAVFPPGNLGPGPGSSRAGAAPIGLRSLGVARPLPSRQRLALGCAGRLSNRVGSVVDRIGCRDALEQPTVRVATITDSRLRRIIDAAVRCGSIVPFPNNRRGTERYSSDGQRRPCHPRGVRLTRPARSSDSSALPNRSLLTASASRSRVRVSISP
jgi:hypothetical protein